MNLIKLVIVALFTGLWSHTKLFVVGVYDRIRDFFSHLGHAIKSFVENILTAVGHLALIPLHAVAWIVGCLKASWLALKNIWK